MRKIGSENLTRNEKTDFVWLLCIILHQVVNSSLSIDAEQPQSSQSALKSQYLVCSLALDHHEYPQLTFVFPSMQPVLCFLWLDTPDTTQHDT